MFCIYTSSTVPPRLVADLMLSPFLVPKPLILETKTCPISPLVSLPMVNNPEPASATQSRITTYSVGRSTRRPSQSRPAFKQKLSSLQSMSQFCTRIYLEESMSIPSVLGPWPPILFLMVKPSTVMWLEYNTCTVQKPARCMLRSSINTFSEFCTRSVRGRLAS